MNQEVVATSNPADPTRDMFAGQTKWIKNPNSPRSYQEVNDHYIDGVIPGTTLIPSALSRITGDLSQGRQVGGIDIHKPGKQLLIDTTDGINQVGVWDPNAKPQKTEAPKKETMQKEAASNKRRFVDPAKQPAKPVPTADIPTPGEIVYLHVPGAKVPFRYHEIIIDSEKGTVILVMDTRAKPDSVPEFDANSETPVVLSFDNYPNTLFCEYYGQTFTIAQFLNVTLLVIAGEEPKE